MRVGAGVRSKSKEKEGVAQRAAAVAKATSLKDAIIWITLH
jgi:hypothetical protein